MEEKRVIQEDEIDLIELIKIIWSRRQFIAKVSLVSIGFGFIIAFTSPKEYVTSCTLIPEAIGAEGNLEGSLGGLASLAGIDLGGMTKGNATINPGLYQSVAKSTPFLMSLLDQRYFYSELERELTVRQYYESYYKLSLFSRLMQLPRMIVNWIRPKENRNPVDQGLNNIIALSKEEHLMIDNLMGRIQVTLDYDLSVVQIEVEMQDPLVSAQIAQFTQKYITQYATTYSISKSKEQLSFIELQCNERRVEFEQTQLNLAQFRDRNRNINTSQAKSEEERLQSEYNLAFNVYNQLAQQRETIRLKVNENTPIFTVLEPARIPVEESKPKKLIILIAFFFGSIFLGIFIILGKNILVKLNL